MEQETPVAMSSFTNEDLDDLFGDFKFDADALEAILNENSETSTQFDPTTTTEDSEDAPPEKVSPVPGSLEHRFPETMTNIPEVSAPKYVQVPTIDPDNPGSFGDPKDIVSQSQHSIFPARHDKAAAATSGEGFQRFHLSNGPPVPQNPPMAHYPAYPPRPYPYCAPAPFAPPRPPPHQQQWQPSYSYGVRAPYYPQAYIPRYAAGPRPTYAYAPPPVAYPYPYPFAYPAPYPQQPPVYGPAHNSGARPLMVSGLGLRPCTQPLQPIVQPRFPWSGAGTPQPKQRTKRTLEEPLEVEKQVEAQYGTDSHDEEESRRRERYRPVPRHRGKMLLTEDQIAQAGHQSEAERAETRGARRSIKKRTSPVLLAWQKPYAGRAAPDNLKLWEAASAPPDRYQLPTFSNIDCPDDTIVIGAVDRRRTRQKARDNLISPSSRRSARIQSKQRRVYAE